MKDKAPVHTMNRGFVETREGCGWTLAAHRSLMRAYSSFTIAGTLSTAV